VDIANYPGTSNSVAKMTTGSPVSLWQLTDTPASAFYVRFDFDFAQADGLISVFLGGKHLGDVSGLQGRLTPWQFAVIDPALLGLQGANLEFRMDGQTSGLAGYLDNVRLEVLPEPSMLGLLVLGGLTTMIRRRR
jgi:hypothetical protein